MKKSFSLTDTLLGFSKTLVQSLQKIDIGQFTNDIIMYNVLDYAWDAWEQYITQYAKGTAHTLVLGINPGPHGMVQTGIPFGNISTVQHYLNIQPNIQHDKISPHPRRPVLGLTYTREEPSGKLLWGTIQEMYPNPNDFFSDFFVLNYCPLAFFSNDEKASNLTPDKLPKIYQSHIEILCSKHLAQYLVGFQITRILAVGKYTQQIAGKVLEGGGLDILMPKQKIEVQYLTHPSPLNPNHKKFPEEFRKAVNMQ